MISASSGLKKSKGIIAGSPEKHNGEGAANLSGPKVASAALQASFGDHALCSRDHSLLIGSVSPGTTVLLNNK